jgi:hypothetical protein
MLYFGAFIIPNSYGASSEEILLDSSSDEYVLYPTLIRILTPGKTFLETRANLFLYEDYHYGYPYFALSALAVLPSRLYYGINFTQHMQLNLLLLRQIISVLPLMLAAGLMVFLQTRFQSPLKSLALFIFLLTIRGVVRNNVWWWHPDALSVLFVVLTIYFLDRDRLRFGRNFFFAAVACGLASATKLLGFAFFLTIPVYVVVGFIQHRGSWKRSVIVSGIFVLLMAATVIFSNPFLFSDEQRARMLEIQAQKSVELSQGYEHDDPLYYSKGPQWWASTIEKWYAPPLFMLFLVISLLSGMAWGEKRLLNLVILTWIVPYSIYLLFFVAVKPDHYWLPVLLPLFSCAFTPIEIIMSRIRLGKVNIFRWPLTLRSALLYVVIFLLTWQFVSHFAWPISGNVAIYTSALERGTAQLQTVHRQ